MIYKVVSCTNEEKVAFSAHMLRGVVDKWWNGVEAYMTARKIPNDWEHFREIFLVKYFMDSLRAHNELEFQHLN